VAPPPVPKLVEPRVRLVRRLLVTGDIRAVVLSAPAGYGKTALVEAWAARMLGFHERCRRRGLHPDAEPFPDDGHTVVDAPTNGS
jgi:hypothetical protein